MYLRKVNKRELYLGIPILLMYILSLKILFVLKDVEFPIYSYGDMFFLLLIFVIETLMVCNFIYWVYVYFKNKKIIKETKDIREKLLITRVPYEVDLEDFFKKRERELKDGRLDNLGEMKKFYLNEGE